MKRIAVVDKDRCKPDKCSFECGLVCPPNKNGKQCITLPPKQVPAPDIEDAGKRVAKIEESLCIDCTFCIKACPFNAIKIIRLPTELETAEIVFQYSRNGFRLFKLPTLKPGLTLGIIGPNGTGKSTLFKLLCNKGCKPNFGNFDTHIPVKDILTRFRGSELHGYFEKLYKNQLKLSLKVQEIELIAKAVGNKTVKDFLNSTPRFETICDNLDLIPLMNRKVMDLSGGELQRFAIARELSKDADVYLFDEFSAFLDISQRLKAARLIQEYPASYKVVIDHDLVVLDYVSDHISVVWGDPGVYGIFSNPISTLEGVNQYLDGTLKSENMRFRPYPLKFERTAEAEGQDDQHIINPLLSYPGFDISLGDPISGFKLSVSEPATLFQREIVCLLGENGMGKTTFIRKFCEYSCVNISYKPQIIVPKFTGTVKEMFESKEYSIYRSPQFQSDIIKPLKIHKLYNLKVLELSGGERQRVGIALALSKPADLYLLDEPSAYLDCEQRIEVARAIRKFILHTGKTALVVEHDFIMMSYLSDRIILFEGVPGMRASASSPLDAKSQINEFLKNINVTFRSDMHNGRPRVNKRNSVKDLEQKAMGKYF